MDRTQHQPAVGLVEQSVVAHAVDLGGRGKDQASTRLRRLPHDAQHLLEIELERAHRIADIGGRRREGGERHHHVARRDQRVDGRVFGAQVGPQKVEARVRDEIGDAVVGEIEAGHLPILASQDAADQGAADEAVDPENEKFHAAPAGREAKEPASAASRLNTDATIDRRRLCLAFGRWRGLIMHSNIRFNLNIVRQRAEEWRRQRVSTLPLLLILREQGVREDCKISAKLPSSTFAAISRMAACKRKHRRRVTFASTPSSHGLVHALTASGAIIAYLALQAAQRGDWRASLQWLTLALLVDGIDGPLARWAQVKTRTPRMDGATLDLVVDYLTYVFIPTVLICELRLVPADLALAAAAMIQLSALYHFARSDLKTPDNYFNGFPALWNIVAFYLLLLRLPPAIGMIVVGTCAIASFLPINFVHPVRVRDFRPLIPIAAAVWIVASVPLLLPGWSAGIETSLLAISLGAAVVLVVIGLARTIRGPTLRGAPT